MSILSKGESTQVIITGVLGPSKQDRAKNYFVSVQDFGHSFVLCGNCLTPFYTAYNLKENNFT